MTSLSYDYVIIGGGTAGLVLAARLSEDPHVQVAVVEAGDDQTNDPRVTTPAAWPALLNTSSMWNFCTSPQKSLGGRKLQTPQGRLLGGSSSVNGVAFTSTSKSNVDAWEKLGNPGWDYSSFENALRRSYCLPSDIPQESDGNGQLQLNIPGEPEDQWPQIWLDTLRGLGFPTGADCLSGDFYGGLINPESVQPATKQRSSAATAYLQPINDRNNLTVITGAIVDRIILSKKSGTVVAEGIQYIKNGNTKTVLALKDVILSAGALNSPRLLELSGIGSAELLQRHGIDVVVNNPYVGENLQNHIMVIRNFKVRESAPETMDDLSRQDPKALAAAGAAYANGRGPLSTGGTYASAQLPFPYILTEDGRRDLERIFSNPDLMNPITEVIVPAFAKAHEAFVYSTLSSPTEGSGGFISFPGFFRFGPDGTMVPPPTGGERYFSVAMLLMHPLSRGSIHIASSSTSPSDVDLDPQYLSHPADLEVAAHHLCFLDNVLAFAEPLIGYIETGGREPTDLGAAREYIRNTAVGASHLTSTCSMMPREMGGVVDSTLRVHGVQGLRVCDASIIPIIPRANTQAVVYGIAERAAEIIKSGV